MNTRTQQQGFAMPVAIFAIVVVGVLVTGGFFVARQESRIGVADENAQLAFYMAERGIAELADSVSIGTLSGIALWDSITTTQTLEEGEVDVVVKRTAERLFFLDGTSRITGRGTLGGASRRLGLMTRVYSAEIDPPAALSTTGQARIGGSSVINGYDSVPNGWESVCNTSPTDKPGLLIDDTTEVTYNGNNYDTLGVPAVAEDSTLTPDSLLTFGDYDWDRMTEIASIRLAPPTLSASNTIFPAPDSVQLIDGSWTCDDSMDTNWGDPLGVPDGACANYFPIIYVPAAYATPFKLAGNNVGQGILLVDGDMQLQGGFTFYGVVIVRGTLTTAGTGGHVQGGVIAANAEFEQSEVIGDAVIQNSTCAVSMALNNENLARLIPVDERSWVDLSNIGN